MGMDEERENATGQETKKNLSALKSPRASANFFFNCHDNFFAVGTARKDCRIHYFLRHLLFSLKILKHRWNHSCEENYIYKSNKKNKPRAICLIFCYSGGV